MDSTPPLDPALAHVDRSVIPFALSQKLKLLPLRERELTTLRQIHQHHLRWIEAAQELMVRLSHTSSIPEALDALLKSLVDEFGFDISASSTPGSASSGDPVHELTEMDRSFLTSVFDERQRSGELVVSQLKDGAGERTLAWLMADSVGGAEVGEESVVVVGRTRRTAPYYPVPDAQETGLYRHLLATVTQVFRSISLQARHNSELERKVFERTGELKEAQQRLVQLEREKIAEQMAGGFAHEMRNALSGAKIVLEKAIGYPSAHEQNLIDQTAGELKKIFLSAREALAPELFEVIKNSAVCITRNERVLSNILNDVSRSVERALSITTLIVEYSRIGYSERGSDLIDVAALARGIVAESSEVFGRHAIVATVRAKGPCGLRGVEAHAYSIFKNLVANAFDALCETDAQRLRALTIELEGNALELVVRVSDSADGIPDPNRARIFEPFFSTKPQTGTGLGLGMVQKLVALHNGTLELDTAVGRGTTFAVCFVDPEQTAQAQAGRPSLIDAQDPGGRHVTG